MTIQRNIISSGLLLVSAAPHLLGNEITYTSTISETLPYTIIGTNGTTTSAILPKFSLSGTLNSITIQQSNSVTIDALSQVDAGENIQGYNITTWNWAVETGFQLSVIGATDPGTFVEYTDYGNYDSPAVPESAEVYFTATVLGNSLSLAPANFSSYLGSGNFNVSLNTYISTQIQPLPATAAGFTWQLLSKIDAAGIAMADTNTVSVTYDYTPFAIPEPNALALIGVASGVAIGCQRLRSKNRKHYV